jgi:hypothetical protein
MHLPLILYRLFAHPSASSATSSYILQPQCSSYNLFCSFYGPFCSFCSLGRRSQQRIWVNCFRLARWVVISKEGSECRLCISFQNDLICPGVSSNTNCLQMCKVFKYLKLITLRRVTVARYYSIKLWIVQCARELKGTQAWDNFEFFFDLNQILIRPS